MTLPEEYVRLGLRFDLLVDGFVDAYVGDLALKVEVANEPKPDPAALARQAAALLRELPSAGLSDERTAFIAGQLAGLEMSGRRLAGEPVNFVDEVEAYFQVRPAMGDPERYAAAHAELDALLPGSGTVAERYQAFRRADEIPAGRLEEAMQAFSSALRDRARAAYDLPEAETVEYLVVTDEPWSGFNYYLGDYRSRVAVNADLPMRAAVLPSLIAHESYPGHHTEHCRKERLLVEQGRQVEHTVFLVNTPECLIAEGLADLGLHAAVGHGWGSWAREIYADIGIRFDGELAEAVSKAAAPLDPVRQDAALLLHDRGATEDDVVSYLARWSLVPEDRARKQMSFLTSPLWRAYTSTYVEGYALLSTWLDAGDPAQRFRRLLDEPLTPSRVAAELVAA